MRWLSWVAALVAVVGLGATGQQSVIQVFPSGNRLPVNALRLSMEFTEPQTGAVLPHLRLRDQDGRPHPNVFLQQELWSPDRKTLTVLFDPGRVKTGTMRHAEFGAPLAGYTGVVLTLNNIGVKRWRVDGTRCGPLNVSLWQIEERQLNQRSSLRIRFPEAIDSQAEHLLAVVDASGRRVAGSEQLGTFETRWIFTPDSAWTRGEYRVVLHPDLENPCGDRIGDAFEHPVASQVETPGELRFVVR